jgi:hypothetical protein
MPTLSAAAVAILRIMTCFPLIDIQFVTLYLLSVIHHAVARDRFPMLGDALSPSIRPSPFGSGLPATPAKVRGPRCRAAVMDGELIRASTLLSSQARSTFSSRRAVQRQTRDESQGLGSN